MNLVIYIPTHGNYINKNIAIIIITDPFSQLSYIYIEQNMDI